MSRLLAVALCVRTVTAVAAPPLTAADPAPARWPQFRGPGGSGIADGPHVVPVEFGPERGLLWKTALPVGHSSPVVWGDRIFLTGYVEAEQRLETLCIDRSSGRILWRKTVAAPGIEKTYASSNPAATTPVTDGTLVFVYFGSYGLVAYDFEGNERWRRPLPMARTFLSQGSGTSPILVDGRLLLDVNLEKESHLLALDSRDGRELWRAPNPDFNGGWATPIVWREGVHTLVGVLSPGRFTAHSLTDGTPRWWLGDLPLQNCATPVAGDGLLYLSASGRQGEADNVTLPPSFDEALRYDANRDGKIALEEIPETLLVTDRRSTSGWGNIPMRRWVGYFLESDPLKLRGAPPPPAFDRAAWETVLRNSAAFMSSPSMQSRVLAVRTGGTGDVAQTHVAWSDSRGIPEVPSPLLYRNRVFLVKSGGIVYGRDATTGAKVLEGRLGAPGGYYASPIAANGRVYVASDAGVVTVFEAEGALQVLARNDLDEPILATPAIAEGKLYVRTTSHLHAFGAAAAAAREY